MRDWLRWSFFVLVVIWYWLTAVFSLLDANGALSLVLGVDVVNTRPQVSTHSPFSHPSFAKIKIAACVLEDITLDANPLLEIDDLEVFSTLTRVNKGLQLIDMPGITTMVRSVVVARRGGVVCDG